jgi:hypothetical protein
MNQLEAFVENLEKSLLRRYKDCNSQEHGILLAVLNAVADAKDHLHDQESSDTTPASQS